MTMISSTTAVFLGAPISRGLPIGRLPDAWAAFHSADPALAFRNLGRGGDFNVLGSPALNGVSAAFTQAANKLVTDVEGDSPAKTFIAVVKKPTQSSQPISNYQAGSSDNVAGDSLRLTSAGVVAMSGSFGTTGQTTSVSLTDLDWDGDPWRFVAGTRNGAALAIYAGIGDGITTATATIAGTPTLSSRPFGIGGSSASSVSTWAGGNPVISEAMVFGAVALSPDEIAVLHEFMQAYYEDLLGVTVL